MKSTVTLGLFFLLLASPVWSQSDAKVIEKKIEIKEGEPAKVTIKTTENGQTTITTLTGEAAEAYIEEHEDLSSSAARAHTSRVQVQISDEDIQAIKDKMKQAQAELAEDFERLSIEFQSLNMDSLMESIGVEVERSMDDLKYQFESINGKHSSVIILHSEDDDDADLDVRVEVQQHDDETSTEVTVTRKRMIVEDHEEKNVGRSAVADLKVYPVPSEGSVTIAFENQNDDPVDLAIRTMDGKVVRKLKMRGEGSKEVKLNLDDLPAGTYFIDVQQGKSLHTKKLILE